MSTFSAVRPSTCPSAAAEAPLLPVVGGDLEVPLATGGTARYVNLDYAASAPALEVVAEHVAAVLPYYASVHRGAGYSSQVSTALYETARHSVGRFLDADEDDLVVFTRHTTDSLNLLAGCVPAGGRVLVLDVEHHANLLPWQRIEHEVLTARPTLEATLADLTEALRTGGFALLALTGASNVSGEEIPLEDIVRTAHEHGTRVVVDAAQLAPHRRISLQDTGIDYVALSGHKTYAPYGAGVLAGRRDWLDRGHPYLAGGGAVRSVTVGHTEWAPAPQRHEAGSPNVIGASALAAACTALAALPEGALELHEEALRERLLSGLQALDGVAVHRIWSDSTASIAVATFSVDGYDPGLLAAILSAEYGIGVRDGKFCAHPLLSRLGLADGAVRASVGVGSRLEDVDRLLEALAKVIATGPQIEYVVDEGRWVPEQDTRELPAVVSGLLGGAVIATVSSPCDAPQPKA